MSSTQATEHTATTTASASDPPGRIKYCLTKEVRRWPYKKLHQMDHKPIATYFDAEPFFSRSWDVFHIEDEDGKSFFLIPFIQVKEFFELVSEETGITIPLKGKGLTFGFRGCGTEPPLFLGQSDSRESYDALVDSACPDLAAQRPSAAEIQMQREKQKEGKKAKAAEKRTQKFQKWEQLLLDASEWLQPKSNKLFVCIDVESYERNHSIITEVGISTLMPTLEKDDYESDISTRHIRISEYRHYRNGAFVADNSTMFNFGETEFISIKDITKEIAAAFKTDTDRSVVLVGHDTKTDIDYLSTIGYDVHNLRDLIIIDTVDMWRALNKDPNSVGLGKLCSELDIDYYHLHNAGNDAHYTLSAYLKMVKLGAQRAKDDAE